MAHSANLDIDIFKIKHNNIRPKSGSILISEPFTQDIYFKRSVVLLTEHSDEGSVGFILNKPVEADLSEIVDDFPAFESTVSLGGPVSTESVHFLHTLGDKLPNSRHVFGNLYWGGDFEVLKLLVLSNSVTPQQLRFFIGYSGWSEKQLDNELKNDFWIVTKTSAANIMNSNPSVDIWRTVLEEMGSKYQLWANFPKDPLLN